MFLWFPVLDLARAPRRTARKKGSGYENVSYANANGFWIWLNLAVFLDYSGGT
jgi:hypothetical protein